MRWGALLCIIAVAGCSNSSDDALSDAQADLVIANTKIDALINRVDRLEKQAPSDYASFNPTDGGWSWLWTGDFAIRIGIESVARSGNGSKVKLAILNPLAANLMGCSIRADWGETDSSGTMVQDTAHNETFTLKEIISAGDFVFPEVNLSDIPPARLGKVTLSEFRCSRSSHSAP